MKKWCMAAAVMGMTFTLVGCSGGINNLFAGTFDGTAYVKGHMDVLYLREFDSEYMESIEITEVEAQETYDSGIAAETEFFFGWTDIEYPTEVMRSRMADIYKQIYAKSDYTVVSSAKQSDDSYSVKVTVRPLDIMQQFNAAYPEYSEAFNAEFEDVDVEAMTDEEYETWYESVYDTTYANGVIDLLESLIPNIGYMEEKSIMMQIEKDPIDGYYGLNDDDLYNLDELIIDYTKYE